ncbi:MAG: CoA transferase [Deltaproteobacteria bacterium]|nr:CoA transferase [Deltaproteobacteria bacterium]
MSEAARATAAGPCAGLTVLDFSTLISGPMCTMILGDLGADVIKIEAPRGDSTRHMGPPFAGGLSAMFAQFNRNKRSVVVDLKLEGGVAVARRLAEHADVVVHNFRPGVAERLGIDFAAFAGRNPRLVYLAISGFGAQGPYAQLPAYDTVIQGLTGHMAVQGAGRTPQLIRSLVADKSTALTGVYAVLAALLARERSGGAGRMIDVAMLDAFAAFILPDALLQETFVPSERWRGLPDLSIVHRTWETADGHVVIMVVEDWQFQALCRVLGREDLIDDERFATLRARVGRLDVLYAILETEIRKWPTSTLVERARAAGAPLTTANGLKDFLSDPQVAMNQTVFESDHPTAGRVRYLRNPVRTDGMHPSLRRHPPQLGEHTDEVLRDIGYAAADIAVLRSGAVVG